jgi:alpha-mannosidase
VEIRATLDWREPRRLLKLRFGTAVDPACAIATAGVAYGAVERPTGGSEEPGGAWADLSGPIRSGDVGVRGSHAGLLLLNDAKPALDARGSDLGITIVRSPIFAHHDPRIADERSEEFSYQDAGIQRFRLVLVPHADTWRAVVPARLAAEVGQRPLTLLESFHDGPLARAGSFAEVEAPGAVIGAIKRAEDGRATVVRIAETIGRPTSGVVRLPRGRSVPIVLGPWQVRTFRVPDEPDETATETDLLEQPVAATEGTSATPRIEDRAPV